MAMENKRITQLSTERLTLTSGDYVMVDDADNGSAKYRLDRLKETDTTLSVSGKAADAAATGQAISEEAEARSNADTALGEDIDDLKSALSQEINTYAYLANGAVITWEKVPGVGYKLTFPSPVSAVDDTMSIKYGNNSKSIAISDILSAASAAGLTVSGRSITGNVIRLVFNVKSQQVNFVSSIQEDDVVLFYSYWLSGAWGALCDSYYNSMRETIGGLIPDVNILKRSQHVFPFFSGNDYITWEKNANGRYTLTLPEKTLDLQCEGSTYSKTNAALLSAARAHGLTVQGNTITGDVVILVFNVSTKEFDFVSSVQKDDAVLYYSYWGSGVWGALCDGYYNANRKKFEYYDYTISGYVSNGGKWEWNKLSYMCDLKIPPRDVILKGTRIQNNITISYSDIIDTLEASSLVSVSNSIVTGNSFSITYNVKTEAVAVHANSNYDKDEVILFAHQWNSGDWGIMAKDGGYNGLNPTWITHINQKVPAIITNMDAVGKNGITFAFATDIHIENNDHYLHVLLAYIKEHTNLKYLITGGDYVNQRENKPFLMNQMRECINEFRDSSRCYFPIVGNHDKNTNFSGETYQSYELTDNEVFSCIDSLLPNDVVYGDYYYYYYDDTITKTRFILLSSGFEHYTGACALGATQLAWAKDVMDSAPSGYHIFVFVHGIYQPNDWSTLTPTYNPDYLSSDGQILFNNADMHNSSYPNTPVVAIFVGHIHLDMSTTTSGGIPVIWTDCDARSTYSSEGYEASTIKSQCMDVVTVDYNPSNKVIKCLRIGRGSDRTFTY